MNYNLSNFLTLFRIAIIPIILILILSKGELSSWIAFIFFVIAALTDFFDGYFARIRKEQTNFGTFLDPIADKLLISSVIFILTAKGTIDGLTTIPALVILIREIIVSGLREFLATIKIGVPVSRIAKSKTTIQIIALAILILGEGEIEIIKVLFFGKLMLWVAAILTLYTAYDYIRSGLKHF